ncbi:nudix domain protein [Colletotrichum truncatum]|uniref:Nudix domain protein n=1 Tax=Colletotrichum truncatum TaxID=5467 RepID=A0ACC3YKJ4_COLTU|nr:nudix domain protein [Colletotrichum truncatum]KAF6783393.1 nudix domain protein [Colletotrichum truncatum]
MVTPAFPNHQQFDLHPSLKTQISPDDWRGHDSKHLLCVGAAVFHQQTADSPPKLLLLQRAAADLAPGRWELTGGGCESSDPTIFDTVVREVWEETGLRVRKVTSFIGSHTWAADQCEIDDPGNVERKMSWRKLSFVVQVEDAPGGGLPAVVLDAKEHQAYLWVTKEECEREGAGEVCLRWCSDDEKEEILRAFELL